MARRLSTEEVLMADYREDPHQQWADDGWGERMHACNENCPYFVGCDFEDSVGVCMEQSFDRKGKLIGIIFVRRQEDREGECVW